MLLYNHKEGNKTAQTDNKQATGREGKKMKYLVQAILNDGNCETVIDSIKTDNMLKTLHMVMKRHKNSYKYTYHVMVIATQHVMTFDNIFQTF